MALTLQQIQALIAAQGQSGQDAYIDPATGQMVYSMRGATQSGSHYDPYTGDMVADPVSGYRMTDGGEIPNGSDRTYLNGKQYQNYDPTGQQTGTGTWQGLTPDGWKDDLAQIAKGAAIMGLTAFGGSALAGGGSGVGGSGAFLGDGVSSGIPAWDAAGTASSTGGSIFGGAGAASGAMGGGPATMGGASMASGGLGGASALPGAGGATSTAGSGLLSGLGADGAGVTGFGDAGTMYAGMDAAAADTLGGGASVNGGAALRKIPSWLGAAATVAGGLLGSQGETNTTTQAKNMLPEMKPYVFGAPGQTGLLQDAQALKDQQMTPQAQAKWQNMTNVGQGLLSQPMAGNGYGLFAGRTLR